jgi:fumarate reductase subunit D
MTAPTTTALRPVARTDAFWLRLTTAGIALGIIGLLMMGLSLLFGTFHDDDFRATDYVLTASALPQGFGLFLVTLGVHRLQHGRDGRFGTAGIWVYGLCLTELVVQCTASVVDGSELIWGPLYPVCAFGLMLGLALLAAGSWRVGLLPRWMLSVWPPLGLVGSFLGIGPIPLVFAAFLALLAVVLPRRVREWPG